MAKKDLWWETVSPILPLIYSDTFFLHHTGERSGYIDVTDSTQNDTVEIGPGSLKMSFSSQSGQLKRIVNSETGVSLFII